MIRGVVFAHSATTLVHLADLYLQNSTSTCSQDPNHDRGFLQDYDHHIE